MKTDLSLVFSQLPYCFFFFFTSLRGTSLLLFVKDSWIFLNWDRKFFIVSCHCVFDLFLREVIEQNIQPNAIRMWLHNFFKFFPLSFLTWVSLRAKFFARNKILHKGWRTRQSLTENANDWSHLLRFHANVREWMKI